MQIKSMERIVVAMVARAVGVIQIIGVLSRKMARVLRRRHSPKGFLAHTTVGKMQRH